MLKYMKKCGCGLSFHAETNDIDIDLVVKKRDKDEYTAIQCKFYDEKTLVSKDDVDTFLSASGKAFYILH